MRAISSKKNYRRPLSQSHSLKHEYEIFKRFFGFKSKYFCLHKNKCIPDGKSLVLLTIFTLV